VCDAKADLVFLLDASSSVQEQYFRFILEFVIGLLKDADIDGGSMRVGAVPFSRLSGHV